jgi:hypothetical protein
MSRSAVACQNVHPADPMSDDEWVSLALLLWQQCWRYGTQNDRRELLAIKARIEAAVTRKDSADRGTS